MARAAHVRVGREDLVEEGRRLSRSRQRVSPSGPFRRRVAVLFYLSEAFFSVFSAESKPIFATDGSLSGNHRTLQDYQHTLQDVETFSKRLHRTFSKRLLPPPKSQRRLANFRKKIQESSCKGVNSYVVQNLTIMMRTIRVCSVEI